MPYIPVENRQQFDCPTPVTAGELAYCLAATIANYKAKREPMRYADHALVVGVLESLKNEYVRRFLEPYEDERKAETEDVW
jgi:hypothetical protein